MSKTHFSAMTGATGCASQGSPKTRTGRPDGTRGRTSPWRRRGQLWALLLMAMLQAAMVNALGLAGKLLAAEEARPNILIITVDNLGYGDLASYNPDSTIPTPQLDALAKQSGRLTSFYTASSTCTVSRACLLTGRVAQRHGLVNQLPGLEGNYGIGLRHSERLIPQLLKQAPTPYATGCFGKWNIGFAEGSRPTDRGFDEFIGHASGNLDYYYHLYQGRHDMYEGTAESGVRELHREGEYAPDIFADAACDFIRRKSAESVPWFCYLPFNSPHFPMAGNKRPGQAVEWQAPDWAFEACGLSPTEKDPYQRYRAVVYATDRAIGRVLQTLRDANVEQQTFLFFMSDNGAFDLNRKGLDVGSNEPLRSGGVTCWEGGVRVAAMARWPGKIEAGSTIDVPLWSPDLLVACTQLAGAPLPEDIHFDGRDPLPSLTQHAPSPHDSFYFQFRSHAALRQADWKIVREKPGQPWMLFNLAEDLSETHDRAGQHPERVERLAAEFARWEQGWEQE
ncbi:MAG: sulfatase-like hydrolase/transferase [Planctomycetales bacterium]|nr:sulfatase-like hydrolase/transferase [Planctomycetales bacterium]